MIPFSFYKEANAVRARLQVKNLVGKMLETRSSDAMPSIKMLCRADKADIYDAAFFSPVLLYLSVVVGLVCPLCRIELGLESNSE